MENIRAWSGVVESVYDPLKMGRVKVRIFGLHPQSREVGGYEGMSVDDLPWAIPSHSTHSAGITGIGLSPHGLKQGSYVFGFARDDLYNDLIILGALSGVSKFASESGTGFNDPDGKFPLEDRLGESDVNRLARGENIEKTIVDKKRKGRDVDIPTATGVSWSEPEIPYAAKYPHNMVFESESGHIREVDDTEGYERLHEYHKSGTFKEIHPDGSEVHKVVGNGYEIIHGDDFIYIKGTSNVTVEGNCNVYVVGDANLKVDGDYTVEARNATIRCSENLKLIAKRIDYNP